MHAIIYLEWQTLTAYHSQKSHHDVIGICICQKATCHFAQKDLNSNSEVLVFFLISTCTYTRLSIERTFTITCIILINDDDVGNSKNLILPYLLSVDVFPWWHSEPPEGQGQRSSRSSLGRTTIRHKPSCCSQRGSRH